MGYDNMHNITRKSQHIEQFGVQFKGTLRAGYDLLYQYADNSQQIANIAEESYRVDSNFAKVPEKKESRYSYDANGNMLGIYTGTKKGDILKVTNNRTMLWDEENRLLALSDNGFVSNYWYDAAGERTVKMSGDGEGVNINGVVSAGRTGTTNFTAYINPYLVVRNGGEYTKHIYMGGQRITSKVSNSGIFTASPVKDTLQAKYTLQTATLKSRYDSLSVQYKGVEHSGSLLSTNLTPPSGGWGAYFYHSDHLGSTSLITDISGEIVQHVEYVPFGGTFIDERRTANSWHTPFLFSGKERDIETGLLYVSQRYQDEKYGIWYSVDQMAEKYPNISSYVYCANNPIIYVDPDGRKNVISHFVKSFANRIDITKLYKEDPNRETIEIVNFLYVNNVQVLPKLEGSIRLWNQILGFLDPQFQRNITIGELDFIVDENGLISNSNFIQGGTIDIPTGPKATFKFASNIKAFIHYAKHVKNLEFNYITRTWKAIKNAGSLADEIKDFSQYKSLALNFFKGNKSSLSFFSKEGTLFKFDLSKGYFGIADKSGNIQTFFKFKDIKDGLKYYIKQIEKYGTNK